MPATSFAISKVYTGNPDVDSEIHRHIMLAGRIGHYVYSQRKPLSHRAPVDDQKRSIEAEINVLHPYQIGPFDNLAYLEIAVKSSLTADSLVSDDSRAKGVLLTRLGAIYLTNFEEFGDSAYLEKAIDAQSRALRCPPDPAFDQKILLCNLGCLHGRMLECRRQDFNALKASIKYHKEALDLTAADDPFRLKLYCFLSRNLYDEFKRIGELSDLESSINYWKQAVSPPSVARSLQLQIFPRDFCNAGNAYRSRFLCLGSLEDLDTAISYYTQGLQAPHGDQVTNTTLLNNLGTAYENRSEYLDQEADFELAISYKKQAMRSMLDRDPNKHVWLGNLGNSYSRQFRQYGNLRDFNEGIASYEAALELAPQSECEDKCTLLSRISTLHIYRSRHLWDRPEDLNNGVEFAKRALQLSSSTSQHIPAYCKNLGLAYCLRFGQSQLREDLDMAIEQFERSVNCTDSRHYDLPDTLLALGNTFSVLSHTFAEKEALRRCMQCYRRAAQSTTGNAVIRFMAAFRWAAHSLAYDSEESLVVEANQQAISSISSVIWMGNSLSHRYAMMKGIAEVVAVSVQAAWIFGRYDLAMEWLEVGRCVIWSQLLQLRAPLNDLYNYDPELATEVQRIARGLDCASQYDSIEASLSLSGPSFEQVIQQNHRFAEQWDAILSQVRSIPRFKDFLQPKTMSDYQEMELKHTVVVLGVHSEAGYAICIRPRWERGEVFPLPRLCLQKAHEIRQRFLNWAQGIEVRGSRERKPQPPEAEEEIKFNHIMAELWEEIVHPVLETLGFLVPASVQKPLPRLIWCATGPLASLPLHAAGDYGDPGAKTYKYVISSYTPTIGTLFKPSPPEVRGIVGVGQEFTEGSSHLPNTVTELNQLQAQAQSQEIQFTRLDGNKASATSVLEAMKSHSWIHLACHASQNATHPTRSSFHLFQSQLDLGTLGQELLEHAELAFLSACQIATGDERLPDEAIHLAAGMLMVGYRAVIATLWSIKDKDAPTVTNHFYSRLLNGGRPNAEGAAEALHDAVECLRKEVGEEAVIRWAPFVHFGQ
ncbi:hypothetical protein FRC09_000106 [Ceratobasidium sp. 395]|nr:hypothetical protein FRC09_000106 [Ceratobasidium sp. 395]